MKQTLTKTDLLLKYRRVDPMKFGEFSERCYPLSAVLDMLSEYADAKLDEAAEVAFARYKENGLTNTANDARESVLNLKDIRNERKQEMGTDC